MMVSEAPTLSRLILGYSYQDLEGVVILHNDTLVIHAIVSNYEITQIFMDARSSVKLLFYVALERMGMKAKDLQSIATPLFGFLSHAM